MLRKTTATALTVSFVGIATSGILMLINKRVAAQLGMMSVHEISGIIMLITGLIHLGLNIKAYLKKAPVFIIGLILAIALGLSCYAGIKKHPERKQLRNNTGLMSSTERR